MTQAKQEIIFVGGVYGKRFVGGNPYVAGRRLQSAAQRFQESFLNGLDRQDGVRTRIVSSPFVGSFPKGYRSPVIRGFVERFGRTSVLRSVWTLNLPVVKQFSIFLSLLAGIGAISRSLCATRVAFVYSVNLPYLAATVCARLLFGGIRVVPIITDLPIYPGDCSRIYRFYLARIEWPLVKVLLRRADDYVVLTAGIPRMLGLDESRCVVMEGIYSPIETRPQPRASETLKSVVYTGSLDARYGVKELVDQFLPLDKERYQLTVYGDGPLREYIESLPDGSSVRYGGVLGVDEVAAVQSGADLLINPRTNCGEYNKYSFPSKLIEYMASGTPVLCYRLDGVPEAYFDYLQVVDTHSAESIGSAIFRVLSLDPSELLEKARRGRQFVLNSKTDRAQIARVLDFLS